jgi:hypothetical protein
VTTASRAITGSDVSAALVLVAAPVTPILVPRMIDLAQHEHVAVVFETFDFKVKLLE